MELLNIQEIQAVFTLLVELLNIQGISSSLHSSGGVIEYPRDFKQSSLFWWSYWIFKGFQAVSTLAVEFFDIQGILSSLQSSGGVNEYSRDFKQSSIF